MTISSVGFSGRVPRLCAQKKDANLPYPVKKVCSFFYKCPLEHRTVFSNHLLQIQRTGNMGTSFFTPLWQIKCTSLVIATLKENDNFLYLQKKVYVTFEMCRSSAKKKKNCDLSSRRKGILKRRPCSHLHPPPSAIKHQSRKRLGKAFPTLPQRPPFCKKGQRESIANNARVDK